MANMNATVDDKAAYAREADVVSKLESVITHLDIALAASAT
jgi:hypothetical protein